MPGCWEKPNSRLGFLIDTTIHLIYSHCLPILISLIQKQSVAMLQEHEDGKSLSRRHHFFKVYFIDYTVTVDPFFLPFIPLHTAHPLPPSFHPLSSCPCVVHISSLASPFPMLFLTSLCLFCTYHLCFLFPVHFPPFYPLSFPTVKPPCDPHFCESVPVLVVC